MRRQRPWKGLIFRVGACPYLLGPINEPRPCKGLISRILLRGKPRPRYAPLTGAVARIDELRREIGASPYPGIWAPFRGNPCRLPPRRNSLIRLIRCYAVRGQHQIAAQPRTPVANIRLIRPPPLRRPSIYLYCSPFSSPRRPKKRNPNRSLRGSSSPYTLRA